MMPSPSDGPVVGEKEREVSDPQVTEKLPATPSENLPPVIPASSEAVHQVLRNWPGSRGSANQIIIGSTMLDLATSWPMGSNFGQSSATLAQLWLLFWTAFPGKATTTQTKLREERGDDIHPIIAGA